MQYRCWAEIDVDAVCHNIRQIHALCGANVEVMAIVKANAYGHGASLVAPAAVEAGTSWLGVATVEEGAELRALLPSIPICHLSPFNARQADEMLANNLTPVLSDRDGARAISEAARRRGIPANAHIEVDTGMCRSGVPTNSVRELASSLTGDPFLRITGMMMHFPCAESRPDMCHAQRDAFVQACEDARNAGLGPLVRHAACSPAILLYPEARLDLVRPGLLMYGIRPNVSDTLWPDLRPVLTLKATVLLVRNAAEGTAISYDHTFTAKRPSRIATLAIGYGDGYPRDLSNRGSVIVRGHRAPIVGRVCMDVLLVDVTDVPGATAGDEAVLIGSQGQEAIRAEDVAHLVGTTEHDITTRLTARVPRIAING